MSYTIRSGDNLESIARRVGTTVDTLARLNDIRDPDKIQAGDELKLPGDQVALSSAPLRAAPLHRRSAPPEGDHKAANRDRLALSGSASAGAAERADSPPEPNSPFLKAMLPAALAIEERHGIPAEVILAQAALESNWGRSAIGRYNVFGIKGEGSLGTVNVSTQEHQGGRWRRMREGFAKFGSFEEAFEAYAKVIHNGSHSRAVAAKSDPVAFARGLQGTYATDPKYASKLISIMRSQNLI